MRLVYFDCVGGAAGDMLLGSLLGAGVPIDAVREGLAGLPIGDYELEVGRVEVGARAATHFDVHVTADQPHRTWRDIRAMLTESDLPDGARRRALCVFSRLATAEARVHGVDVESVHFHEVGAVDAIVDIVGVSLALDHLDIETVRFGLLEPGHGTVECAHGVLPVPAPATLELLYGIPLRLGGERGEWITPTGAALLTALGQPQLDGPRMRVDTVGIGCGTRRRRERPNIVRALLGEWLGGSAALGDTLPAVQSEEIAVLEAAVDDQTPEALAHAVERLREAGALDAVMMPIVMKKGRSGVHLQVLAPAGEAEALAGRILAETSTLGVRVRRERRLVLSRRIVVVETDFGPIRVKETVRPHDGAGRRDAAPEAVDVARAARTAGVAFHVVAAAALAAYGRLDDPTAV